MIDDNDVYDIQIRADTSDLVQQLKTAQSTADSFARSLTRAFTGIIARGRSVSDTLKSLALRLSELALKAALKPLENLFSNAASRFFTSGISAFSNGGVISQGLPVPFASGGVVDSPVTFPMANGRTGLLGEAGPEAILPLARGSDGKLGVRSAAPGGGGVTMVVNIAAQDVDSFRRSETEIGAMLARAVAQGQRNL